MTAPAIKYISVKDYLTTERAALEKHEYYQGEAFAMSGASLKHNRIQTNVTRHLGNRLEGNPFDVFGSDLRVHIPTNSLFTYPDAVVVCGEPELLDQVQDTILNPSVIFEVLSPSTQSYDRGDKFKLYRDIPSLQDYILIATDKQGVEHYHKAEDGWHLKEFFLLSDMLNITTISCTLPLAQIYEGIVFNP